MAGISIYTQAFISNDLILLLRKEYEEYVLEIMNKSKSVFPGKYEPVNEQSHGECDFIDVDAKTKYDAKLPFNSEQVELLTTGKKHKPKIGEWISEMRREAAEFDIDAIRAGTYDVTKTMLYSIIYDKIKKDKDDENIIFFLPFPIGSDLRGSIFSQFTTDYLRFIYNRLCEEFDLTKRSIFAIYPSSEKNLFAVRNLCKYGIEYVECPALGKYFTYEIVGYDTKR